LLILKVRGPVALQKNPIHYVYHVSARLCKMYLPAASTGCSLSLR
jgi:hypothetical protein